MEQTCCGELRQTVLFFKSIRVAYRNVCLEIYVPYVGLGHCQHVQKSSAIVQLDVGIAGSSFNAFAYKKNIY